MNKKIKYHGLRDSMLKIFKFKIFALKFFAARPDSVQNVFFLQFEVIENNLHVFNFVLGVVHKKFGCEFFSNYGIYVTIAIA